MCSKDIMEGDELPTPFYVKTYNAESHTREISHGNAIANFHPNSKVQKLTKQAGKSKKKSAEQKYGEDLMVRGSRHRSEHPFTRDFDVVERCGNFEQSYVNTDRSYKHSVTGVPQSFDFPSLRTSYPQPYLNSRSSGIAHGERAIPSNSSGGAERSCMSLRELPTNPEALPDAKNHIIFSDSDVRLRANSNGSDSSSSGGRHRQNGTENDCQIEAHERESEARNGTKDYCVGRQAPSSSVGAWIGAPEGRANCLAGSGTGNRGAGRGKFEAHPSKPPPVVEVGRNMSIHRENGGGRMKNFDLKSNGQAAVATVAGYTKLTERETASDTSWGGSVQAINGSSACEGRCWPDLANPKISHENVQSRHDFDAPPADDSVPPRSRNAAQARPRGGETTADLRATVSERNARQENLRAGVKCPARNPTHYVTQDFHSKTPQEGTVKARELHPPAANASFTVHIHADNRDRISSSSSSSSSCSTSSRDTHGCRRSEERHAQAKFSSATARRGQAAQGSQVQNVRARVSQHLGDRSTLFEEASDEGSAKHSRSSVHDQKSRVFVNGDSAKGAGSAGPMAHTRIPPDYRNGDALPAEQVFNLPGSLITGSDTSAQFEGSASGIVTKDTGSRSSFLSVEDFVSSGGYDRAGAEVSTLASVAAPCGPLRRLKSFPGGTVNAFFKGLDSEVDIPSSTPPQVALGRRKHSDNAETAANLRGLLPKARDLTISAKPLQNSDESAKSWSLGGEQLSQGSRSDRGSSGGSNIFSKTLQPSSPAQEICTATAPVFDSIRISCEGRQLAHDVARDVGYPMAEFERVLEAMAPGFCSPPLEDGEHCHLATAPKLVPGNEAKNDLKRTGCSLFPPHGVKDEFACCRCKVADVSLRSVWQWYEEPSCYGAAVKSYDEPKGPEEEDEDLRFVAYFVPYLSATQIFGYSQDAGVSDGDCWVDGKQKMRSGSSFNSQSSSKSVMLATLFPSPGKSDVSSSTSSPSHSRAAASPTTGQAKDGNGASNAFLGNCLLYEFSEIDPPYMRRPLFSKVEELSKRPSVSNSYSNGDPKFLDELRLGDIHPASWFAVAWYPIYRISEGPLRTVFLTYHSFNHLARRRSMITQIEGPKCGDDIFLPAVGLECYNFQGEPWLSMGGLFSREATKTSQKTLVNFSESLQNRLTSLQAVAAVMGKGVPRDDAGPVPTVGTGSKTFSHSDYEFFVKRRR